MSSKSLSPNTAIFILSVLYTVGVIGILLPLHEQFVRLTPLNLLVSLGLVLFFHPHWKRSTWLLLLLCFGFGFGMELLGVQTGLVFGDYSYGQTLGWKIWETPLMIGFNWVMLVYCSGVTVNHFLVKHSPWLKTTLAATLMVLLDILIEPIAIRYDFWSWAGNEIPLQNYLAWFGIAFVLLRIFFYIEERTNNKVAIALFILQFLFFGILNLF